MKRNFSVDRLNQALQAKQFKQNRVALELGTHVQHVSRWCSGKSVPGGIYLGRLADLLDVPVDFFYSQSCEQTTLGQDNP